MSSDPNSEDYDFFEEPTDEVIRCLEVRKRIEGELRAKGLKVSDRNIFAAAVESGEPEDLAIVIALCCFWQSADRVKRTSAPGPSE